jgi:hypothetical protein
MNTLILKVFYLILITAFSYNAMAGFRCNNGSLVSVGNKTFEVIENCGQPYDSQHFGVVEVNEKDVYLERWTYVSGKGKLVKYVEFHNGVVVNISTGSRIK